MLLMTGRPMPYSVEFPISPLNYTAQESKGRYSPWQTKRMNCWPFHRNADHSASSW